MKFYLGIDKLIHLEHRGDRVCNIELVSEVEFLPNCHICKRAYEVIIGSRVENISLLILAAVVFGILCIKYSFGEV